MKVLLTSTSLLPDYGGPALSVSRLATALADAGAKVGLWASDRSAAITPLLAAVSSVNRIIGDEFDALDRFGEPDILHDNGIWLRHNHRFAAFAEKRVRRVWGGAQAELGVSLWNCRIPHFPGRSGSHAAAGNPAGGCSVLRHHR